MPISTIHAIGGVESTASPHCRLPAYVLPLMLPLGSSALFLNGFHYDCAHDQLASLVFRGIPAVACVTLYCTVLLIR